MSEKFLQILCVIVILVGLLQIIAALLGSAPLGIFARSLAASPKPMPLTGSSSFESFSSKATLTLAFAAHNKTFELQKDIFANLQGPHKRKIVFLSAVELPRWGEPILKYAFCQQGIIPAPLKEKPKRAIVEIESRKDSKQWTRTIYC